ncbi:hypothetical protein [Nostoc sp. LPT]|uniref:hypothetical protein n=1 Tax=Nostoc sp. LPT TaxID=2815387 RepID=UPI001D3FA67E|nr:hypothetical protein [Nostoc sp. LPT]MBN4002209.1 hypothetical protein [Nostoc sp. LPT]
MIQAEGDRLNDDRPCQGILITSALANSPPVHPSHDSQDETADGLLATRRHTSSQTRPISHR